MAGLLFFDAKARTKFMNIGTDKINPNPAQPRRKFDEAKLYEFAESIRQNGILQPIIVRSRDGGRFEIVAGERRFRAAKLVGLKELPCIIRNYSDEQAYILSVIENIQRNDLNFFEEAVSYEKLIRDYGLTQEELAQKLGRTQSAVANKLRLLKIEDSLRPLFEENNLTERHARCVLRLPDTASREKAVKEIIGGNLNVAQTEALILSMCGENKKKEKQEIKGVRYNKLFKDMRIFSGTINKTIEVIKKTGIPVVSNKKETDSFIEYIIRIEKPKADV